ncbi:DUF4255 domain-containing protein [Variovorax ureilyticus]|uniref:DUF4255 domain-containing protein n=1 Tax=Variovorax ureilyticus TaxID=1836198 RepID=A0ABU8VBB5_9BURK
MSSALAIASVTRGLRALVNRALQAPLPANLPADTLPTTQIQVTTLPLDKVRTFSANGNLLNLYLYSTVPNPALSNGLPPRSGPAGGEPPLALNLHYMLTAFGQDDNELIAQLLLGRAMLALHDNPLLMPSDLADALGAADVQGQIERVRITPHSLGFEEMSKLWMAYQTQYRLSAAYEASVVLIDSARPARVAPPVRSASIVVAPFRTPSIEEVTPQVAAPGATMTLAGWNLGAATTQVVVAGLRVTPSTIGDRTLSFTLPAGVPAGVNTVRVVQEVPLGTPPVVHPGAGFESNAAAFMLSPSITTASPVSVARGTVLQLSVAPAVGRSQRVVLLLDDQQVASAPHAPGDPDTSNAVAFPIPAAFVARSYLARVMVDGACSALATDTTPASPTFNQFVGPTVTLT